MSIDTKFVDKRGEDRPRQVFVQYPRCPTCRYCEALLKDDGTPGGMVCVIDPPKMIQQIRGEDEKGGVLWAGWCGFPVVNAKTRCGKHSAADAN